MRKLLGLATLAFLSPPIAQGAEGYDFEFHGKTSFFECMEVKSLSVRAKYGLRFTNEGNDFFLLWKNGDVVGEVQYNRETENCDIFVKLPK